MNALHIILATVEPVAPSDAQQGYTYAKALHKFAMAHGYSRLLVYADTRSQTHTTVPRPDRSGSTCEYVWVPESDLELPYVRLFYNQRVYNVGWTLGFRILNTSVDSMFVEQAGLAKIKSLWSDQIARLNMAFSESSSPKDYVHRLFELKTVPLTRSEEAAAHRKFNQVTATVEPGTSSHLRALEAKLPVLPSAPGFHAVGVSGVLSIGREPGYQSLTLLGDLVLETKTDAEFYRRGDKILKAYRAWLRNPSHVSPADLMDILDAKDSRLAHRILTSGSPHEKAALSKLLS